MKYNDITKILARYIWLENCLDTLLILKKKVGSQNVILLPLIIVSFSAAAGLCVSTRISECRGPVCQHMVRRDSSIRWKAVIQSHVRCSAVVSLCAVCVLTGAQLHRNV